MTQRTGICPVWKPEGYTSFDVIARLRGMLQIRQLGHGGTLDPMATGVLPVFVGCATKLIDFVPDRGKEYVAALSFGKTSDTGDRTGRLTAAAKPAFDRAALSAAADSFLGEQMQLPPMYSAVKVNGQRLYDLARAGKSVERAERPIRITEIEVLEFSPAEQTATIRLVCSKGTYVRVLAEDLAKKLGTGAYLTALTRTRAMGFTEAECHTLAEIEAAADKEALLLPASRPFAGTEGIRLPKAAERRFKNGEKLSLDGLTDTENRPLAGREAFVLPVFSATGALLGMGERRPEEQLLRVRRLFHLAENDA